MALQFWIHGDNLINYGNTNYQIQNPTDVKYIASSHIVSQSINSDGSYCLVVKPGLLTSASGCITLSAWCYFPQASNGYNTIYCQRSSVGNTGLFMAISTSSWLFDAGYRYNMNPKSPIGEWFHVAFVIGTQKVYAYQNGELIFESTRPSSMSLFTSTAGTFLTSDGGNGIGQYPTNSYLGYIQDIRVWNEELSAKQIKELSLGLAFHLPLDHLGYNNLLNGNIELTSAWSPEGVTLTQDGDALKVVTGTANAMRIYNSVSNVWLHDGDTYTVSFWAKAGQANTVLRWSRSISGYFPDCPITTEWKYYSVTGPITGTSTNGTLSLQGTGTYWIKHVKLERNSFATRFCLPGQNIESETVVYDTSGFGYQGIKYNTVLPAVPTPRYNCCSQFNASSSYFRLPSLIKPITVALWVKWISVTTGQSIIFVDNNSYIGLGLLSSTNSGRLLCSSRVNTTTYQFTPTAGIWYHFVIICPDGATNATRIVYINGALATIGSGKNNWNAGGSQLEIGKRSSSGDGLNGMISDFRSYATPLSEADVKELYETSMSIDSNGNILPRILTT